MTTPKAKPSISTMSGLELDSYRSRVQSDGPLAAARWAASRGYQLDPELVDSAAERQLEKLGGHQLLIANSGDLVERAADAKAARFYAQHGVDPTEFGERLLTSATTREQVLTAEKHAMEFGLRDLQRAAGPKYRRIQESEEKAEWNIGKRLQKRDDFHLVAQACEEKGRELMVKLQREYGNDPSGAGYQRELKAGREEINAYHFSQMGRIRDEVLAEIQADAQEPTNAA